ncbi:MAG TPA: hypothetical protein PKA34_12975 [Blastocatellia bacterium]|nr:hypothetical protein [Blastocatellia bacterium]
MFHGGMLRIFKGSRFLWPHVLVVNGKVDVMLPGIFATTARGGKTRAIFPFLDADKNFVFVAGFGLISRLDSGSNPDTLPWQFNDNALNFCRSFYRSGGSHHRPVRSFCRSFHKENSNEKFRPSLFPVPNHPAGLAVRLRNRRGLENRRVADRRARANANHRSR